MVFIYIHGNIRYNNCTHSIGYSLALFRENIAYCLAAFKPQARQETVQLSPLFYISSDMDTHKHLGSVRIISEIVHCRGYYSIPLVFLSEIY